MSRRKKKKRRNRGEEKEEKKKRMKEERPVSGCGLKEEGSERVAGSTQCNESFSLVYFPPSQVQAALGARERKRERKRQREQRSMDSWQSWFLSLSLFTAEKGQAAL